VKPIEKQIISNCDQFSKLILEYFKAVNLFRKKIKMTVDNYNVLNKIKKFFKLNTV